jgi:ElaA protein
VVRRTARATALYDLVVIPPSTTLHVARFAELDPGTLYALLRLRTDVFVVEQRCAYPELDGRDTEPGTRHLWLASDGEPRQPLAYLRLLAEPDGTARVGRVCTAAAARGRGLSGRLMTAVIDLVGDDRPCVLDAQSYLVDFYAGFGFVASGADYVEDGIAHTPMRLP